MLRRPNASRTALTLADARALLALAERVHALHDRLDRLEAPERPQPTSTSPSRLAPRPALAS